MAKNKNCPKCGQPMQLVNANPPRFRCTNTDCGNFGQTTELSAALRKMDTEGNK